MAGPVTQVPITDEQVAAFQRDGVVMLPGVMADWVEVMRAGVARNLAAPSEYANENGVTQGRFFDDYVNWRRIPEFERVVRESPAAEIAARAMRSPIAQFFHDHVLVKAPGTPTPTPWHQDGPYYLVEGAQTVSFWMPLDPVDDASLRFIAGSHRWETPVRPVTWSDDSDFYAGDHSWTEVPDPDAEPGRYRVLEWPMQPGDVVLFDFRTVHGARGNFSATERRALSLRWVGEDARHVARPGRTSPPFPGHAMQPGQRLREDWFPVIWRAHA
ncbi:MAG TPA: phytanoyl-CoA dioxygenase [Aliiroseovarius sp.]|nr:phytanoyl-CoA dioxygenase [Aliiroseovarius sp.]